MAKIEPQFRQAETVQLAPDALVFINGSDTIKDNNNNVYEIRNDITDITTSLSVDSTPGTAGFTISLPDHSIRRTADNRYDALKIMSEIEIYFKGRFPKQRSDGTEQYPYYPAFWGVIISIIENYSDGTNTIAVSCADILRWWQITTVNINPSVVAAVSDTLSKDDPDNKDQKSTMLGVGKSKPAGGNQQLTQFETKFAKMNIGEILIHLSKINLDSLVPAKNSLDAAFGSTDKINSSLRESIEGNEELMIYWRQRFNQIGRNLRIFGANSIETNQDGVTKFSFDEENFLDVKPYVYSLQSPNPIESTMKSKLEIANELKDSIQFEFYMDVNGEIIFKPPFYNMNVITNQSSVVRDLDIISWNFNQNEAEVITRVDVKGRFHEQVDTNAQGSKVKRGIWIDFNLAKKFGYRVAVRDVTWLTTKEACLQYAQGEMARLNALARQGSITITGRPELRLGYPVYIPSRDAFYYIKSIDHSFSFGGSFSTTVTLVAERRHLKDEDGNDIKWGVFRNVGEVKDETVSEPGSEFVDKTAEFNNFVKQFTDACTPTKGSNPQVNEANFKDGLGHIASIKMGDWSSFRDIKLADSADLTSEYQTSDGDGYELVTPFKYGSGYKYSDTSVVDQQQDLSDPQKKINENADKAQALNPVAFKLEINPNNTALTLDEEHADASMLYLFDRTARTSAEKAQEVNPQKSGEKTS